MSMVVVRYAAGAGAEAEAGDDLSAAIAYRDLPLL
jgi:hypothetical protein